MKYPRLTLSSETDPRYASDWPERVTSRRCWSSSVPSRRKACTSASWVCLPSPRRECGLLTGAEGGAATSIVAEAGGRIVAFAGFHRDPQLTGRAEVAFAVSDAVQGHGIGTRLLEHLADIARDQGITTFDAYVSGQQPSDVRRVP